MKRRRIAFVTTSRAEYGLARWILRDLEHDPSVDLTVIASGTHCDQSFGNSISEIEQDEFAALIRMPLKLGGEGPAQMADWLAQALQGFVAAFQDIDPDILLLVGDRVEMLSAAQAAVIMSIPIAHIHGGEITEGAIDDGIRHAISKLSDQHFVSAPAYGRRLLQMGAHPANIHVVGSPGLCAIVRDGLPNERTVRRGLRLPSAQPYGMVTYHPVTAQPKETQREVQSIAEVIRSSPDYHFVLTGTNADLGRTIVDREWQSLASESDGRVQLFPSLGHSFYLAALRDAAFCLGNSSSGVLEAPAVGTPTVNVGRRQVGRLRAQTVTDVAGNVEAIKHALDLIGQRAPTDPQQLEWWFRSCDASRKIADVLATRVPSSSKNSRFRDCSSTCETWQWMEEHTK